MSDDTSPASIPTKPETRYLAVPGGRIGYDVTGTGPLVVLVPGMGDLRSTYRLLTPELLAAGYRVATTDLRGHGDSDTGFDSYGDEATAGDIVALVDELGGGPATVVGNSLGAGATVIAAANRPDAITRIALLGPFVRNPKLNPVLKAVFALVMARPWIVWTWKAYLPTLYAGHRPADFAEFRDRVVAALRRPGYARAFAQTVRQTDHAQAEVRLGDVRAATLVVMGDKDPDFKDPTGEAQWIGQALHARVVLAADAGHYPQSQQPEATATALIDFMGEADARA